MTAPQPPQRVHLSAAALQTVLASVALALLFAGAFATVGHATYDNDPAVMRPLNHWSLVSDPAVNTQATATRAAAAATVVHVADCVTATFIAGTTAPAAVNVTAVIRDGATGAGTVLWAADFTLAASISAAGLPMQVCGLDIAGSSATAMTVEFTAAGGANTFEAVTLSGYDRLQ